VKQDFGARRLVLGGHAFLGAAVARTFKFPPMRVQASLIAKNNAKFWRKKFSTYLLECIR